MLCREQVAQLRDAYDRIRELGAELVAIGSGTPEMASDFGEQYDVPFPILVDPKLVAFAAARLHRSLGATFNLSGVGAAVRAFGRGHRQGRVLGDAFQQGGEVVIAPGDRVLFHRASEAPGDHADVADVLAALERA